MADGPLLAAVVTTALLPELDPVAVWSTTATVSTAATFPVFTLLCADAIAGDVDDEGDDDAQPVITATPKAQATSDLTAPDFMIFSFRGGQQ